MASAPVMARSRFPGWRMAGLLVLVTVLAYQPVWHAGFIWDDGALLLQNPGIQKPGGLARLWRGDFPMVTTNLWLEWRMWGANPLGYHLVNVLLHGLSAVALWRVLRRLSIPGAGLAAAIFAVHPVNVESVAWISERKNTLCMFLYLGSLLLYLRFDEKSKVQSLKPEVGSQESEVRSQNPASSDAEHATRFTFHGLLPPPSSLFYWLSVGVFVLALLSKTAVAPLPLVLLGLAWWQRGRLAVRDVWRTAPFFILSAAAGLLSCWFQVHQAIGASMLDVRNDSFWSRLGAAGWAIWFYLYKALLPLHLSFVYPRWRVDPAQALSYVPGLLVLAAFLVCWRYRHGWGRAALLSLGYFVVMLLPVLGFVNIYFMRFSLVADHWQYFAIIGPIALIAGLLTAAGKLLARANRRLGVALGGALILVLGELTWQQSHIYAGQETLWQDTVAKNPACWMAHINLGNVLGAQGQIDEPIRQYQEAIRLQPNNADAHNNLGATLIRKGQSAEAIRQFREALRLQPDHAGAHYNLGAALDEAGQIDEAIRHYQEAIRVKPESAGARYNLGTALLRKGQTDEAIRQLREVLRLQPDHADAHNPLGIALSMKGKTDEAIGQFREALRLKPDDASAKRNLARALELKSKSNARTPP